MKWMRNFILSLIALGMQSVAHAAESVASSPSTSLLKMCMGLVVVLAVMALVAWLVKRLLPGGVGQQSIVRVVGGASVGARERVVVLEIGGRWIVVGVTPGQVNRLANLEAGNMQAVPLPTATLTSNDGVHPAVSPMLKPLVKPFAEWLKKAAEKHSAS